MIIYERIRAWLARLRGRPDPGLADMAKFLPVSFSLFMVLVFFSVVLVVADIVNPVNFTGWLNPTHLSASVTFCSPGDGSMGGVEGFGDVQVNGWGS